MEIISYVGFEKNRQSTKSFKNKFLNLNLKLFHKKESKNNLVYKYVISPSSHSFIPTNVEKSFSLHSSLSAIGKFITKLIDNWKAFCFVISAIVLFALLLSLANYSISHTGPLKLKINDKEELEIIDKVMSSFIFDTSISYTENGDIIGSVKSSSQLEAMFKKPVTYQTYTVKNGDTIDKITKQFGLTNLSTIIAINNIKNVRSLYVGQKIEIPSIDGILYKVEKGNSLAGLSAKFNIPLEDLLDVNDLSTQNLTVGQKIFIPGAKLDTSQLHEVLGDLFKKPISISYRLTSTFGWRNDPFTGVRSYHTGIDMACPQGTPVRSAMSGVIAFVGWSTVFGNYIIVNHQNGYQTLYGHLSQSIAKKGDRVTQSSVIGKVGSTGYSTGAHLHFTVYKNGQLVNPMSVLR